MPRAPIPRLAPGEHELKGPVAHYLGRVLRLRSGDGFVAFDPASGCEAEARVVWSEAGTVRVRFDVLRPGERRARRETFWIQGLAKGEKTDAIVRDATELGVTRFVVAATRRSIVKLDGPRASERQARWTRIAREAARQCGRSDSPVVDPPRPWSDALALPAEGTACFCLWESATEPLAPVLLDALAREVALAFACGPEGGLEESEVEEARAKGWFVVSLGAFTLRTETVAAAVLGATRALEGLV
jgi:16S rRNA (uracil1498-N3)-methyltransferase